MADIKAMLANMSNGGGNAGSGDEGAGSSSSATASKVKKPTTIEQIYQKKSQLEHILLRPDTYIGSVEKVSELMWIYDVEKEMMVQKQIEYVPGLYKIFDEILVNAADNKQRDKKMDCIKIDINPEENRISVWNNGQGIPVVMHKDENMYVPTMIFGHLLTSSNYNDNEEKVTGGRNGYGAKLCNIFSDKFIVETASKQYKRQFKQTWGSNMSKTSEPKVKDFTGEDFTKITFYPDLKKFKMDKLDNDIVGLMSRRAYDIGGSTRGVKVFLNGQRLPVKSFKDYVDLYIKGKRDKQDNSFKVVYESPNERWEVAFTMSDCGFQQMSFVNSIATTKGGRHVDYVVEMIVKQLLATIKKKNKGGTNVKPFQVKNHMWIFVNCLIVNPTFDSQTKESMTLQVKSFGSKCNLSEKFIGQVLKSGIVETVLSWAKFKAENDLAKATGGRKTSKLKGIPKLEDANKAGEQHGYRCTLILTEGDSAKSLAVSGLSVIGRDYYGVFPLKGKLLNVREATFKQIKENAEINNLVKIIGLQYHKKYNTKEDIKSLRYGKLMIMTDQDQDGSHIKGLLINFIHYNWPELLRLDFLEEFITPIVKAKKKNQELSFYSLPEFEEWKRDTPNHHTFQIKYYKGLGTSTSKEAKEYFSNMDRHRITFRYDGQQDDDHIVLAFSKKHIEDRKEWLTNFMVESKRRKELGLPERYLYTKDTKTVNYKDFVNLELVLFSNADNIRSIPSLVDGLKPGQRKVLFTCFKRNDKREVKVAQLAGSVAEHSAYHHGEQSLCMTIVNLAQNYVGSNNINLLEPSGQFGTRLCGGKDSASPRYIFTKMSPLTRMIFHPHDDALLKHEYDDNQKIEPEWYIPIIPMVLVNGADGIGTGWMTKIPNYNPREIAECLKLMLDGKSPTQLRPWYKNYKGTIEECGDQRYCISGEISIIDNRKAEITELPVGTWTQNYKENTLEPMLNGSDKAPAIISDYKEYNTDTTVRFIVTPQAGQIASCEKEGWHKVFKLQTVISTSSMVCFDELGCIRKFESVMDILQSFFTLRLTYYQKRKDYLQGMLEAESQKLSNQARFIMEKCNGTLTVENKKRKLIVEELVKRGYNPDPVQTWKQTNLKDQEDEAEDNQNEEEEDESATKKPVDSEKAFKNLSDVKKFDYLLGMSMWMLTEEKKNELLRQRDVKIAELDALKRKSNKDLWRDDLDVFLQKLDEVEEKERKDELGVKKENVPGKKQVKRETLPLGTGQRIEPVVSDELKKKIQNALKTKENKGKRGPLVKKEPTSDVVDDEFDAMIKDKRTLDDKLNESREKKKKTVKASDGLKQTKLNFDKKATNGAAGKKRSPGKKTKTISNSEPENVDSDGSFEVKIDSSPVKERTNVRRAATKPIKYILSDDDEEHITTDDELHDNVLVKENVNKPVAIISDESEEDEKPPPAMQQSSEDLFDSLMKEDAPGSSSGSKRKLDNDSEDDFVPKSSKAKTEKPKKPRAKKKKINSDEDKTKKSKSKKTKLASTSDDDDDFKIDEGLSDSPVAPPKKYGGRAATKKTYKISDDDYSD